MDRDEYPYPTDDAWTPAERIFWVSFLALLILTPLARWIVYRL